MRGPPEGGGDRFVGGGREGAEFSARRLRKGAERGGRRDRQVHKEIKNWKVHHLPIMRDALERKIRKFVHDHVHTTRQKKGLGPVPDPPTAA